MMLTVSIVSPFAQGPLLTVHVNTFTPSDRPVTDVVGSPGTAMNPVPLMSAQVPVAGAINALPLRMAWVVGRQIS